MEKHVTLNNLNLNIKTSKMWGWERTYCCFWCCLKKDWCCKTRDPTFPSSAKVIVVSPAALVWLVFQLTFWLRTWGKKHDAKCSKMCVFFFVPAWNEQRLRLWRQENPQKEIHGLEPLIFRGNSFNLWRKIHPEMTSWQVRMGPGEWVNL